MSKPEFLAASGSAKDLQAAIDAAGNWGIVRIPEGTFDFAIDQSIYRFTNSRGGIVIPGGVDLIGAGVDLTTINVPLSGWVNSGHQDAILGNGSNELPIRISGMTFRGSVIRQSGMNDDQTLSGIVLYGVKDYRVDHIKFLDWPSMACYVDNNYMVNPLWNMGVIDHCSFDNPYKAGFLAETGQAPIWGYGVGVGGDYYGIWKTPAQLFGKYIPNTCFIEDCSFYRCRHAIASSDAKGFYVARHNYFTHMINSSLGSYIDAHGGARGMEVYANVIEDSPTDADSTLEPQYWGQYLGRGINPRGGSGLYYGNQFINCKNLSIVLSNDQSTRPEVRLNGVWIGANTYTNSNSVVGLAPNAYPIVEGTEYFLRMPDPTLDGFTYTPYPYPHPLITGVEPPPTNVTPKTQIVAGGTYRITVPNSLSL